MRAASSSLLAGLALATSACTSFTPAYERPASPVPAQLPAVAASGASAPQAAALPADWRQWVLDDKVRGLVELALQHNRDLRVAALNIDKARAQLGLAQADRWPTVNAGLSASRAPNTAGVQTSTFQAGLSVTAYEADLWGRVRALDDAAQARLAATDAAARTARLSLTTAVVSACLALVADQDLLDLSQRTLATREESLRLTRLRAQVGAVADPELRATESLVAQSRATAAQLRRQQAADESALAVLIGQPLPEALRPAAAASAPGQASAAATPSALLSRAWLGEVQPGLSSDVLLQRPDIVAAEQQLIAAHANIGAARAAMFPRLSLSTSVGSVTSELSRLFSAGTFAWTLGAQAAVAVFDAGRNRANVAVAQADRDIAVAQYEKAIQGAFKEAADAIQGTSTWSEQLVAQQSLLESERDRDRLTRLRYERGAASALELLDSQRSLFTAEQGVIQTRLAELQNRLALVKALGGWPASAP